VIFYYALPGKLEQKITREQFYAIIPVNEPKKVAFI
jgi:hypothetical protein